MIIYISAPYANGDIEDNIKEEHCIPVYYSIREFAYVN